MKFMESSRVEPLGDEELANCLRNNPIDDSAFWLKMMFDALTEAILAERNHTDTEDVNVSRRLLPGEDGDRRFAHAMARIVRAAAAFGQGKVPYTAAVHELRRSFLKTKIEMLRGWCPKQLPTMLDQIESFLNHVFSDRYIYEDFNQFVATCEELRKKALATMTTVREQYFEHRHDAAVVDGSKVIASVNDAKNEVINAIEKSHTDSNRKPRSTKFMEIQRAAVRNHVEIDCHRHASEVTEADCYHVWNNPKVKSEWDERAKRTDSRRGYPNCKSLRAGLIYWLGKSKRTSEGGF